MKYFLTLLCVIFTVIACAEGENDETDECRIDGKVYKVGEKFSKPGQCLLYTCEESKGFSAVA